MRGIKNAGIDEVDLLGVRPVANGQLEAWHVEVQISFSPIAYISQLCKAERERSGRKGGSAASRSFEVLEESVAEWIQKKFDSPRKCKLRNDVWPGLEWKKVFVHAVARHPQELKLIEKHNVTLIPFRAVLIHLTSEKGLTGASGTDISDIIRYYGAPPSTLP